MVNIFNLERDGLSQANWSKTHNGDNTEWRLNTLQNTVKGKKSIQKKQWEDYSKT